MDQPRSCGCKASRSCLICEAQYNLPSKSFKLRQENSYIYCPQCCKAYPGWNTSDNEHPNHTGEPQKLPGVYIELDFLSPNEEEYLVENMDEMPWDLSQSGRKKQNFGPKCNFKKNKLKIGDFKGFPRFSKFVQDKFQEVPILENFHTIEQCSMEYTSDRGASCDPHIDDCWIWGERIVTVNLLSDSVLTLAVNDKLDYYNLSCVKDYPSVLTSNGEMNTDSSLRNSLYPGPDTIELDCAIFRIPMPRRSLLVLYGEARYGWQHQVLREDIDGRRLCIAYREFTPPYLPGGRKEVEGNEILERAKCFW